jgi:hypothetical protein
VLLPFSLTGFITDFGPRKGLSSRDGGSLDDLVRFLGSDQ